MPSIAQQRWRVDVVKNLFLELGMGLIARGLGNAIYRLAWTFYESLAVALENKIRDGTAKWSRAAGETHY